MIRTLSAIGLDFGSDTIKLVRAERRRGGVIVFTHAALLRRPVDDDTAMPVIRRWLESLRLPHSPYVVGLPGRSVILKSLEMERSDPRTPAQAAGLEIQKLRHLTSEDISHDARETAPKPDGTRQILLFMVRPGSLTSILERPTALGLEVAEITPAPVALFNLIKEFPPAGTLFPAILLNIGHSTTELSVGDAQGLRFFRTFDIGAGQFASALASDTGLTSAQAHERLQKDPAIFLHNQPRMAAILKSWHEEVLLSLDTYNDRFSADGDEPRDLLLAGGGAQWPGLADELSRRSSLKPRPFPALTLPGDVPDPSVYALAAGLALAGTAKSGSRISLVPEAITRKRIQTRKRIHAAVAAVLLTVAATALLVERQRRDAYLTTQAEAAARQTVAQQKWLSRLSRLQQENSSLLETLRPLYQALETRIALIGVIQDLSQARMGSDWIVTLATTPSPLTNTLDAATSATRTNAMSPPLEFIARGYTPDAGFHSVRAMIERLHQINRNNSVDLVDESLPPGDAIPPQWAPIKAIPFALNIRVARSKALALPSPDRLFPPPPATQADINTALRSQEDLTRTLLETWTTVSRRLTTFKSREDLFNLSPQKDVALIDLRVAMQEARQKWTNRARAAGIPIPADLAVNDAVFKDKDARILLCQLGAVQKWLDCAFAAKVTAITSITLLDPVAQTSGGKIVMQQYPLRITFKGGLPAIMAVLQELGREPHFMTVRQAALVRPDATNPDLLEATLEVAALDFPDPPDAASFPQLARQP